MEKKIINIQITSDGVTNVETEEFKGEMCVEAIQTLLRGIVDVKDVELKPEYYEKDEYISTYVKEK